MTDITQSHENYILPFNVFGYMLVSSVLFEPYMVQDLIF